MTRRPTARDPRPCLGSRRIGVGSAGLALDLQFRKPGRDPDTGKKKGVGSGSGRIFAAGEIASSSPRSRRSIRFEDFWLEMMTSEPLETTRATVLLVEDEVQVRRLVRRILEGAGHEVFTAEDAEKALQLWPEIAEAVDLVVTDVVMPGRNGPELVRRLREGRPDLPTLYISAYRGEHESPTEGPNSRFLAKPFAPGELLEAVGSLIGDEGTS